MLNAHMFGYSSGAGHAMPQPSLPTSKGPSDADFHRLEERLDRLSLINMAMWSLLRDKTHLSEQDLLDRVKLIDLLDGKEDGKATRTVSKCTACGRPMHPRHKKCIYCGNEKLIESAFDTI
ncbi:MAG: hypothetical protein AAGC44_07410 [Planctomycetota bacterium]